MFEHSPGRTQQQPLNLASLGGPCSGFITTSLPAPFLHSYLQTRTRHRPNILALLSFCFKCFVLNNTMSNASSLLNCKHHRAHVSLGSLISSARSAIRASYFGAMQYISVHGIWSADSSKPYRIVFLPLLSISRRLKYILHVS